MKENLLKLHYNTPKAKLFLEPAEDQARNQEFVRIGEAS